MDRWRRAFLKYLGRLPSPHHHAPACQAPSNIDRPTTQAPREGAIKLIFAARRRAEASIPPGRPLYIRPPRRFAPAETRPVEKENTHLACLLPPLRTPQTPASKKPIEKPFIFVGGAVVSNNKMNAPTSWLFADNSRYSTRSRLLFMGLSFAIGIATFLLYLAIWYACRRRRSQLQSVWGVEDQEAGGASPGSERRGMSDAAIAELPTFTYELSAVPPGVEDDEQAASTDCAVCLGQVEAGEKVRRLPKCAHLFHAECVDAWLRAHCTCPMCRAAVGPAAAASSKKDGTSDAATPADATTATAEALPPV